MVKARGLRHGDLVIKSFLACFAADDILAGATEGLAMTPRHGSYTGLVKLDGREVVSLPQRCQHNMLVSLHLSSAHNPRSDSVVLWLRTTIGASRGCPARSALPALAGVLARLRSGSRPTIYDRFLGRTA